MLFTDTFTVAAATTKAAPVSRELAVTHGILHLVEVVFLDGPENEVLVAIERGKRQIVPTNADSAIVGNADTVAASLFQPIEESPYTLTIKAWSPSATYDHQVTVRCHILPRELLLPPTPELGILRRLGKMLFGKEE